MIAQHITSSDTGALPILQVGFGKDGTVGAVIGSESEWESQIFLFCSVMGGNSLIMKR